MPWPRAAKPTLQEFVPLREVSDQESQVLRASLWDPEEQAAIYNSLSRVYKDLMEQKLMHCVSSLPVIVD